LPLCAEELARVVKMPFQAPFNAGDGYLRGDGFNCIVYGARARKYRIARQYAAADVIKFADE